MGAGARVRDLRDRAGVGPARADRGADERLRAPARSAGRPGSAPRRRRAPTPRSRSRSRCSRRARQRASALAFQFASTNLVWELGLVLWVLIGWQFTLAEYVGGIVMIVLMTVLLRLFVSRQLEEQAREHAHRGRHRPSASHGRRAAVLARAADLGAGVVGRRAQLPRRLADALEGDHDRVPARRVHRPARQRLLRAPVHPQRARRRCRRSRT